jgi:hypothetical protein
MGDMCPDRERVRAGIVKPCLPGPPHDLGGRCLASQDLCSAREHEFWPDSVSLLDRARFRWNHVQGYRQITDVYLLALVISNQGRLATFDSSISLKAVEGAKPQNLDLIAA